MSKARKTERGGCLLDSHECVHAPFAGLLESTVSRTDATMIHPEEYTDTDPRAMKVWLDLLRQKTPGERIDMALALTDFAIKMAESGVRARYPGASEREVFLRAAALRLPRDLMIRAYGWDPEQHAESR
jgi:hypothetical protein